MVVVHKTWFVNNHPFEKPVIKYKLTKLNLQYVSNDFKDWYLSKEKSNIYFIIHDTFFNSEIMAAKCLIDCDYASDELYFFIVNLNNRQVKEDTISFSFMSFENFIEMVPCNYRFPLLFHNPNEDKMDRILELKCSSSNANGIDVIFKDDYIIYPKGTLQINIVPYFFDMINYPDLFIMRSRFAKLGCIIHHSKSKILIKNLGYEKIDLGNCFLQICLPVPFSFNITNENFKFLSNNFLKYEGNKPFIFYIILNTFYNFLDITLKNNKRKCKF